MDFKEMMESLEDDQKETILSAIEAERQKGIKSKKQADAEAIKAKEKLKDLGWNSEEYDTFDAFKETITKKVKTANDSELSLATLNEKITTLTNNLADANEATTAKTKKLADKAITKRLSTEIGDKLYAADLIIKDSVDRFKYDEDTDSVLPVDGTMEEAVQGILDANKPNLKMNQQPGDETNPKKTQPKGEKDFVDKLKERMS